MEHAGDFVLKFAAAVYESSTAEVADFVTYPITVMTPQLDIIVDDDIDMERVLAALGDGIRSAGVTHMERRIISAVQTGDEFAVVTLQTQRFGDNAADLGEHSSTLVLDAKGETWTVRSLTVAEVPDRRSLLRPVQRHLISKYGRDPSAKRAPHPSRDSD